MAARGAVVGRARVVLDVDKRPYDRAWADAERETHRRSRALGTAMRAGSVAAAAGLTALAFGAVKAVQATSNLEEQVNKISVVFRGSEKDVLSWSKTTASAFGISRRAALEAAGTFGNMLVPMGFARGEASKMSMEMVELAADMASFNNASPEETLDAIRAGLAGESEPLRRFGVFLNDARLKQEALNLGLYKGTGNLDASAKAAATYALILKDTKDAQGDFGRTSDSLANQQRILRARIEDLGASLGRVLLPAASAAAGVLNDIVGFIGRLASAPSVSVGIDIATQGVRDLGARIKDAVSSALRGTDWGSVGRQLGSAIGSAIVFTTDALNGMLASISDWVQSHAQQIAEIGAEIVVRLALTLTDPTFWAQHLDLLAILLGALLFRGMGRVAMMAIRGLGSLLGRGMSRLGGEAAYLFMAGVARLPARLGDLFADATSLAGRALTPLASIAGRVFKSIIDDIRSIPGFLGRAFRFGIVAVFFRLLLGAVDKVMGAISTLMGALAHLPFGLGKPFRDAQKSIDGARERLRHLKDEMTGLDGKKVDVSVNVNVFGQGGLRRDGIMGALQAEVQQNPFAFMPSASATGSAAGLKPMILDELALGRAYGLTLSSGLRPGAVTSSGNRSLHAEGQAIDMSGSGMAMAMFSQAAAGRPGIAEVIYSPVGWWHPGAGWRRVSDPEIERAHYDHVHVGARSGDGLVGARQGDGRKGAKAKQKAREKKAARAARIERRTEARAGRVQRKGERVGRRQTRAGRRRERSEEDLETPEGRAARKQELSQAIGEKRQMIALKKKEAAAFRQGARQARQAGNLGLAQRLNQRAQDVEDEILDLVEDIRDLQAEKAKVDTVSQEEGDVQGPQSDLPAEIQEAIFDAEGIPGVEDDIAAHQRAEAFLQGELAKATTAEERLPIKQALRDVQEKLAELRGQTLEARTGAELPLFEQASLGLAREFGSDIIRAPSGGGGQQSPLNTQAGGGTRVVVNQNFHKPPEDPHPLLRSAKFAAEAVMG